MVRSCAYPRWLKLDVFAADEEMNRDDKMMESAITTRKVLIDNVSKSSAKGYFSSPMGLTRRYGFCCGNCVRQSPTTIFSVRRAWAPFRHGKSDRCPSVSGSPLTADVMQTDTWQTPLTGS